MKMCLKIHVALEDYFPCFETCNNKPETEGYFDSANGGRCLEFGVRQGCNFGGRMCWSFENFRSEWLFGPDKQLIGVEELCRSWQLA